MPLACKSMGVVSTASGSSFVWRYAAFGFTGTTKSGTGAAEGRPLNREGKAQNRSEWCFTSKEPTGPPGVCRAAKGDCDCIEARAAKNRAEAHRAAARAGDKILRFIFFPLSVGASR